ncbi:MAG: hypothetical protein NTW26_08700 [bacterium]|nr:hypothetical protein [bacterium]
MRKIVILTVVLAVALLFSCTTTTDGGGGGGLLKYAFDWAYDIAKKYAQDDDNWGYWDSGTVLAFFDCVLSDEKCMLGRPLENSYWEIFFQNDNAEVYSVMVDENGDEDGTAEGTAIDFNEVPAYDNDKLEEMMTFCLDPDNDYWSQWDTSPDDYWWFVEVSSDYNDSWSGVDNIFRVWFFESQGDIDPWSWWGYIVIDCDGHGIDYDILASYKSEGPHVAGSRYDVPLGLALSR